MPVPPPSDRATAPSASADWSALGQDVVEHSPPQLVQAIGSRVWSEDGAEYIDFDNAGGAVLLGHRDPAVVAAVRMTRSGIDRRGPERYRADVAEPLLDMIPGAEACAFGANVSQALRGALDAARLLTGRELVFDETLSGFRVHEGGGQALYGVTADLAVFGDNLANGMPLGALAGRRALIDAVEQDEPLRADVASLAAAKAVLTKIRNEPVIAALRVGGAEIQAETATRLRAAGLDAMIELQGDPAASVLHFHAVDGLDSRVPRSLWMNECLAHRLFTLGCVNMSYAHGEREIAALLAAFDQAVDRLAMALRQAVPPTRPRAAQSYG